MFSDVCQSWPIEIKSIFSVPDFLQPLLVCVFGSDARQSQYVPVLYKRVLEIASLVACKGIGTSVALRCSSFRGSGCLNDLVDVNRDAFAAQVFRSL